MINREKFSVKEKIQKAHEIDKKIEEFTRQKEAVMNERKKINTYSMLQRIQIKDALHEMTVKNK